MTESIDPRLAAAFDKAAEVIMAPYKEPISTIYMDSDWLYDYRLGEVLLNCKGEDDYKYVMDNLDAYQDGRYTKTTHYFPRLNLTEKDLDDLENNPETINIVHAAAPGTNILTTLDSFILAINTHNRSKEINRPVEFIINQRRLEMPKFVKSRLLAYMHDADPSLNVRFTKYPSWSAMDPKMFESISILFIYDTEDFCSANSIASNYMRDLNTQDKIVYARVRSSTLYDDPKKEMDEFKNFDMVMTLLFKDFRDEKILIPVQRK